MRSTCSLIALTCMLATLARGQSSSAPTPAEAARSIVDRVLRETSFDLQPNVLTPVLEIQAVDFGSLFGSGPGIAYAQSIISVDRDTVISFGMSRDLPLTLEVNGAVICTDSERVEFVFDEIGYEIFRFNDTLTLPLKQGQNRIVLKTRLAGDRNIVYLREMLRPGRKPFARFASGAIDTIAAGTPWIYAGVFGQRNGDSFKHALPPELSYEHSYAADGSVIEWRTAPQQTVFALQIRSDAVYRRESYAEWAYPTGTVMLSLLQYARVALDTAARSFVERYAAFTFDHLDMFRRQYTRQHALRGTDHKLFRCGMLDDTGAPALPFAELLGAKREPRMDSLVSSLARYVMNGQLRLRDGTFYRYEPIPGTVWADDLFMSVPFMMRMGAITGDRRYFDDAARQVINFNTHLVDKQTGLYRHGWYSDSDRQAPVSWGRANGWVIWATTEVLRLLPPSHPLRPKIIELFRSHMTAIAAYQAPSGMWHQVLDRPESFEETSCTALFIIGMARGMQMNLLDQRYRQPLINARRGLLSRISADGRVKDICRGTELNDDPAYYLHRERFDNDPRGLGAVITACCELMQIKF
jgi:unsaturated rhamnogalacturonyl hydrolase